MGFRQILHFIAAFVPKTPPRDAAPSPPAAVSLNRRRADKGAGQMCDRHDTSFAIVGCAHLVNEPINPAHGSMDTLR